MQGQQVHSMLSWLWLWGRWPASPSGWGPLAARPLACPFDAGWTEGGQQTFQVCTVLESELLLHSQRSLTPAAPRTGARAQFPDFFHRVEVRDITGTTASVLFNPEQGSLDVSALRKVP
jgi:hypothetical protein